MLLSSFYNILYIVMAIFGILALGGLTGKEHERKKKKLHHKEIEIDYHEAPDPMVSDTFRTYVGGARFYTDRDDQRCFVGFVFWDPDDEAPRIYRNDMKMLGHIPRERLGEYRKWCPGETYPCVGYILRGNNAEELVTELRVVRPHNREYVEREFRNYIGWVTMTHGTRVMIRPEKYDPLLTEAEIEKIKKRQKHELKL